MTANCLFPYITWDEAVLQAITRAGYCNTKTKPKVSWDPEILGGRWVVSYDYEPVGSG